MPVRLMPFFAQQRLGLSLFATKKQKDGQRLDKNT